MSPVDLGLIVLLLLFGLRGFWRGFFRESFGFAALIVGIAAALRFMPVGDALLSQQLRLPPPIPAGVAFVAIFVVTHTIVNLMGVILDWAAAASAVRSVNGIGGAVFGIVKGAAIVAFLLLFVHLFPLAGTLDAQVMRSSIGRPLVSAASRLMQIGIRAAPGLGAPGQT